MLKITFKDTDSGTNFEKTALESLLNYVEDGKLDVVLGIEQDHLSRRDALSRHFFKFVTRK
ncbi:hypothetical protein ADM90_16750 [Lysinibacillus macroides]|uniref:Uncharacterized protein n=1 Tax=Lysinibacillus macroides TaxID=33935 RepID=A0A0M9DG66_9BACI|nr:hypothetical protein ADM90_16750 [Lysinibacillus macroides]